MKWTVDQQNSIYAPPAQIVVSAAAGSGKTQVLTTRIIERIKDTSSPVSVEKLLIVTFTKAAAAEMKERIGKALRNAAKEETNLQVRNHLKKQLMLLGSAHICTIDSFCYDVVRQNFFKVNLPSDISIGESGELSLLKLSALEETVDSLYCALEKSKGTPLSEENLEYALTVEKYFPDKDERALILTGFEQLTNTCSYDKRDSEFSDNSDFGGDYTTMIAELHRKAQASAYPEKWINDMAALYDSTVIDYNDTPAFKYAFLSCRKAIDDAIVSLENACRLSADYEIGYEDSFSQDIASLKALLASDNYEALYISYKNADLFLRLKGKKRGCDEIISSRLQTLRKSVKEILTKTLSPLLQFSLDESEGMRKLLYPQIKALCCAAILLDKIYYEKMTSRHIIDFSACEHLALKIISEDGTVLTEAGEALKNRYDEIYIDEFQDSNNLQDILFSLISKGRTFMVGDVKQSIYGFRNADPTIFMQKCDESSFDAAAKKRKIFLSKNFRSGKSVINAVNSIFDAVMIPSATEIDYASEHRLDFGTDFMPESVPGEKCEIALISKEGKASDQVYNEAKYIASAIKELINEKRLVWDKDEGRQREIMYSDIAVLMRSASSVSNIYETVFSQSGIPCYIDGGNDLYETTEVGQILEILKLIDNAKSDISLACALRSPMFMFDENELLKIKLSSKESFFESFYGICKGIYKAEPALAKKCKKFMKQLTLWRKSAGFVSVEELIRRIYNDTSIYSSVLSFPDGELRRANLDLLLEKAEEFERSNYSGLFNFVTYIQKMKRTSNNAIEAKAVSEKMNVVRIMTIHKSKGLEFPIVFLAGCAKHYHTVSSGAGGLIINSRAGIGMNYINPVLRCRYKSPIQQSLILMAQRDEYAEEMRLLYVALTRAREKLYVVATLNGYDAFENLGCAALEKLTSNEIFSCNSYISLIALAFMHGADKYWSIKEVTSSSDGEIYEDKDISPEEFKEDVKISQLLDFEYPYSRYINLPGKASVSFLKSLDVNLAPTMGGELSMLNAPSCKKISFNKPRFDKNEYSGAFIGTVHHKFLQYYDYKGKSLKAQIDLMCQNGILTAEESGLIQIEKLEKFISSELGRMLRDADKIYREEPFVISLGANELDASLDENEKICVQGIIDCYFVKNDDTVVLVDYKTDKYENPQEIAEKYYKQLYYYEIALKRKFKDKLIQKYLYLLHKNDIIELQ